jgi:hypothetical protein
VRAASPGVEAAPDGAVRDGFRVAPEASADREPDADAELSEDSLVPPVSATAAAGIAATHAPIPRATARAPIRPT